MNLPEPSGSSPKLKPPGITNICASLILLESFSILSFRCLISLFPKTNVSTVALFSRKASSVSYSLFVPGNATINTLTSSTSFLLFRFLSTTPVFSATSPSYFTSPENTLESSPKYASLNLCVSKTSPFITTWSPPETPIFSIKSASSSYSTTIDPRSTSNNSPDSILKPIWLPRLISIRL